jgi:hypothetical protein
VSERIRIRSEHVLGEAVFLDLLELFPSTLKIFDRPRKVDQVQVQIRKTKLHIARQNDEGDG